MWSKMLNKKKANHAYLVKVKIGLIRSNLCIYIMQTSSILPYIFAIGLCLASITKKGEIEREIGFNLFL
jgi:hypothetical protein